MPQQILETFRGRNSWLVVGIFLWIFVFLGLAIWSAVRFVQAEELKEIVGWAVGFTFFMMSIGLMKIWYWMELNKNTLTREMKRIAIYLASKKSLM